MPETREIECWICGGDGELEAPPTSLWMAPRVSRCPNCDGTGREEVEVKPAERDDDLEEEG